MTDRDNTQADQLIRAAEIGTSEGLKFVYAGNRPGEVGEWENTRCPNCSLTLIERFGYLVRNYRITPAGQCPDCGTFLPGIWPNDGVKAVKIGQSMTDYYARLPRRVQL